MALPGLAIYSMTFTWGNRAETKGTYTGADLGNFINKWEHVNRIRNQHSCSFGKQGSQGNNWWIGVELLANSLTTT